MNVLDLFSGIGGFSLGLERAGMRTVAFCECEPYPRAVLAKHWPNVPCYPDVRYLTAERLAADEIAVDVICGGFPCQDVSTAGKRAGLGDTRSGLWSEFARLIGELRPAYVIVENTPGLLSLGMGSVLGDLASLGYDAEWNCIPACYVGADHIRDRVWIIAYPNGANKVLQFWTYESPQEVGEDAPHADGLRELQPARFLPYFRRWLGNSAAPAISGGHRTHKPVLGRGVHGISGRVDRLKALGNTVVPQIPELIGRAIMTVRVTNDAGNARRGSE